MIQKHFNSLSRQVGGNHYKQFKIQPIEFIHQNNIPFIEGNIVKYICRWRDKNGIEDLEKIKQYVDILIDFETKCIEQQKTAEIKVEPPKMRVVSETYSSNKKDVKNDS